MARASRKTRTTRREREREMGPGGPRCCLGSLVRPVRFGSPGFARSPSLSSDPHPPRDDDAVCPLGVPSSIWRKSKRRQSKQEKEKHGPRPKKEKAARDTKRNQTRRPLPRAKRETCHHRDRVASQRSSTRRQKTRAPTQTQQRIDDDNSSCRSCVNNNNLFRIRHRNISRPIDLSTARPVRLFKYFSAITRERAAA